MSTLKEKYDREVAPQLMQKLGLKNRLSVPRVRKVVVNMGFGVADRDVIKKCTEDLARITGQRPVTTKARKSISNFKIRAGMVIGAKVTLRGARMYEFLDRFINAGLPRIRDFRGVPASAFDGHGNYTVGVREQTIFPEVDPNEVAQGQGMDITIVTSTRRSEEAVELLRLLGMPFAKS
jgi:large subunit ribosomal protein L5